MKSKFYLFLMLLGIASKSVHSQNSKSAEILGKTFSVSFNQATDAFMICEHKSDTEKDCKESIIKEDTDIAFTETLRAKFDETVATYTFKILEQEKVLSEFENLEYKESIVDLDNNIITTGTFGTEIELDLKNTPEDFPKFSIKKTASNIYVLSNKEILSTPVTITDTIQITFDKLKEKIEAELNTVKKGIADDYKPKVKVKFSSLLQDFYTTSISEDEIYTLLTTQKLYSATTATPRPALRIPVPSAPATPAVSPLSYNFLILLNDKMHLKVYKTTEMPSDAVRYGEFDKSISESEFVGNMITQHSAFEDSETNRATLGKIYHMIKTKKETKIVSDTKKQFDDDLASEIDKQMNAKTTYSGQMVLNKKVPLYYKKIKYNQTTSTKNGITTIDSSIVYGRNWYLKKTSTPRRTDELVKMDKLELEVDSLNVHFFNNRADNITIIGRLSNDDKNKTRVLINRLYSLPLRELNNRSQTNSFFDEDGKEYTYYYDDILDYLPYNKYNYAVKNGEIKVRANDSVRVKERKIGDYFTGIFFSDFLGLNTNNSNSLIVAEGRIRIPFNLRNIRRNTWFDNVTAYVSVNLFSGFENSSRKVTLDDSSDADETSEANAELFTTDNFNLLNNNNIDAGIHLTPYTFEWKGASTFVHFRYGLRFLRTGVEYNLRTQDSASSPVKTELKGFQIFSIGQEAEVNFEIRPQASVGADLSIGFNWFRANGTNKNDVDFSTTNNAPNFKVMANIYSLTNSDESNAGVYFRIGGNYNLGNYKVFPQFMVGYATNLSSFVNKVQNGKN
jgi:hypothetical protein